MVTVIGLVLGAATVTWAQDTQAVKLPVTIQDHLALAANHEQKATEYRQEAAYHRKMLEEIRKKQAVSPKSSFWPAYEKMRRHCEPIIRDAERLAKETDKFAEWHRMRAAELEGR